MLARIRNSPLFRATDLLLLIGAACALSSCATKQEQPLIASGTERESALPWNRQEKWEGGGQFGSLAEQQQSGRR